MVKKENHHTVTVDPSSPNQRKLPHWLMQCLVYKQGTQQPAPLLSGEFSSAPFVPYCMCFQPLQTSPTHHRCPLRKIPRHVYGHTHAQLLRLMCLLLCFWMITDWGATHLSLCRLGKAAITCNVPHLHKARATICKNTQGKSHTNPALIKTT